MPHVTHEVKLDYKDVLLRPKRSTLKSRNDVVLQKTYKFRHSQHSYQGIPVVASNMDTTGTFEMAAAFSAHSLFTCVHKHYSVAQWLAFAQQHPTALPHVAISSGTGDADFAKLVEVTAAIPSLRFVCLDVANGYSEHFVLFVAKVRAALPSHVIMAGNVVTGEMVEQLLLSGADVVKVGIGPGSVCTTRAKAGVGYPQLSAVLECADAAHGLKGLVMADGGCTCPGDVAKAFGAGADFVMLGGMLAGHDQSGGQLIEKDGRQYKEFYGMASATAMNKYQGAVNNYRASEGKAVQVKALPPKTLPNYSNTHL